MRAGCARSRTPRGRPPARRAVRPRRRAATGQARPRCGRHRRSQRARSSIMPGSRRSGSGRAASSASAFGASRCRASRASAAARCGGSRRGTCRAAAAGSRRTRRWKRSQWSSGRTAPDQRRRKPASSPMPATQARRASSAASALRPAFASASAQCSIVCGRVRVLRSHCASVEARSGSAAIASCRRRSSSAWFGQSGLCAMKSVMSSAVAAPGVEQPEIGDELGCHRIGVGGGRALRIRPPVRADRRDRIGLLRQRGARGEQREQSETRANRGGHAVLLAQPDLAMHLPRA